MNEEQAMASFRTCIRSSYGVQVSIDSSTPGSIHMDTSGLPNTIQGSHYQLVTCDWPAVYGDSQS